MVELGPGGVVAAMVEAYAARDAEATRSFLADDVRAWVTNAEGGVDPVDGAGAYVDALFSLEAPVFSLAVAQALDVSAELGMAMVEVKAERQGRDLHNFSAFLARVRGGRIEELWMVEALPEYSAEFWS